MFLRENCSYNYLEYNRFKRVALNTLVEVNVHIKNWQNERHMYILEVYCKNCNLTCNPLIQ